MAKNWWDSSRLADEDEPKWWESSALADPPPRATTQPTEVAAPTDYGDMATAMQGTPQTPDGRSLIQRIGDALRPAPRPSVMEGMQPTQAQRQAEIDRRLSYGAGPISQDVVRAADALRSARVTGDRPVIRDPGVAARASTVAREMGRRGEQSSAGIIESANRQSLRDASADERAQEWRTAGEWAVDTVSSLAQGVITLPQLVTDIVVPDSSLAKSLRETRREWQDQESDVLKAQRDVLRRRVESEDGFFGKYAATVAELVSNPALAMSEAIKQVPMFLGVVGGARLGGAAAAGAVNVAGRASPTVALGEAISGGTLTTAARVAGTKAGGIGASMVMAGGDAAGSVYEKLTDQAQTPMSVWQQNPDFQQMVADGADPQEAIREIATAKARMAALVTAPLGLLGFAGAEAAVASRGLGRAGAEALTLRGAGRLIGKDLVGEQLEEGGTQLGGNVIARTVDPSVRLGEGVPEAMGQALVTSAPFSVLGAISQAQEATRARSDGGPADAVARYLLDPGTYDPTLVAPTDTVRLTNFTPPDSPTKQAGLVDIEVPLPPARTEPQLDPITPQDAVARAQARLDELFAIGQDRPDQAVTLENGVQTSVPGERGRMFTPEEADEYRFLRDNIDKPERLAERFGAYIATPLENIGGTNVGALGAPGGVARAGGAGGGVDVLGGVGVAGRGAAADTGAIDGTAGAVRADGGQALALGGADGQPPARLTRPFERASDADLLARTQEAVAGQPAEIWTGRRGDGYLTQQDAEQALPGRQRMFQNLQWGVEQMPNGKFRLAGYIAETNLGTQTPQAQQGQAQGLPGAATTGPAMGTALEAGSGAPAGAGAGAGLGELATGSIAQSQRPGALATPAGAEAAGISQPLKLAPPAPLRTTGQVVLKLKQSTGVDAEIDTSPLTEGEQAASAMARLLGKTITMLKSATPGELPNGFVIPSISAKNIYLAKDSDDAPLSVVMHEVYHTLPEDARKSLNKQLLELFRQDRRGEFAAQFKYDLNNQDLLDEEIPAFMVQAISKRADFWEQLREKMGNREFGEVAKVILTKLGDILTGARKEYGDEFVNKYITDVTKARDLLTTAYADAMKAQGLEPDAGVVGQVMASNRARSPLGFYSALGEGVRNLSASAAPARGWQDAIKGLVNKGQAKADEVEWSGVNDWLDLQQGKVTKEQVQQYLEQGGVQVEETVLSDEGTTDLPAGWRVREATEDDGASYRYVLVDSDNEVRGEGATSAEAMADGWDADAAAERPTKYANYTLPGGPLSRDTEILTRDGWMRMDEVQIGDEVMTRRDEDGGLEWQPVEALPTVYAEKLYHFKNQSINMRVTPCHKMVVKRRRRSTGEIVRVTAEQLWGMSEMAAPLTGSWGGGEFTDLFDQAPGDVAELLGWFIAEGHYKTESGGKKSTIGIAQCRAANRDKCDRIELLLNRMGIAWNYSGGQYWLGVKRMSADLVQLLHAQGKAADKYVPGFMFNAPASVIQRMLDGLLLGDGCLANQSGRKPRWTYHTKSKQLADGVQVLALLAGKRGTVSRRKTGLYTVAINDKQWASIDDAKHAVVDYNDIAYCVTVKNHSIYVRTSGVAAFTGNSNYREVLLTLPIKAEPNDPKPLKIERRDDGAYVLSDKYGPVKTVPTIEEAEAYRDRRSADDKAVLMRRRENEGKLYRSGHWDQPNVLAHIRVNDRTDAAGKRVLFVEEIQSDFGQATKKQRDAIGKAVDADFNGIIERMKAAGVLTVECD
jgi:intein/homing endonuclease